MTTRLKPKISVTALCAVLVLLLIGCSINTNPTYTPTLQPASATQPVTVPIPTDTPTPAQTSASNPTPEPQASAGNSGLTIQGLETSKSLMLDLINQARRDAGLNEVVLGDNTAAQMHAEDMRENCFSAQWGSDGTKPYMRYTLAGGTQYSLHATTGTEYCPPDPDRYRAKSLEEEIREVKLADDVLLPHLKKVNLGFAYSRPNLWVVQQFEGDYIDYSELPTISDDGKLSFSASVKNGAVVKDDALGVQIHYDPIPHELTRGQLARTYCYSTGKQQLASLREPLTDGRYYTDDEYTETDDICVDPYEIDPDSPPANSYEESSQLHDEAKKLSTGRTEPYKVAWITADQWITTESDFSVSANIKELLVENSAGVYTILIWGEIDGEDIPISEYSIFVTRDQVASMNLDAPSQPTNTPTTVPEPQQINSPTPVPTDTPTPAQTNTSTPVPIDTPIPTPTTIPTDTPTPAPTNTSTPTPEPSPTNTSTPTPVLIRNSGLTAEELQQANSLMLDLINQARRDAGLNEVALGDNTAAQMHAEDMRKNCFFAHWGSDGAKPYIRYTRARGIQYEAENVSGTNYCPHDPYNYIHESLETKVREAMDGLMDSPGHRRNILTPHHKKVNLGFSYSRPNLWVVQQFEGDYIEFQGAPRISNDGQLSFSASAKNGAVFNTDGTGVRIYYDPLPHELTRGQLVRTYCYSTGKQAVADLERPLSQYSYYIEGEFEQTNNFCVDPYQISPSSASANSYENSSRLHDEAKRKSTGETEPYTSKWLTAEVWDISESQMTLSADLRTVLSENKDGAYTVVIWGEIDGEEIPISNYSIFVTSDQISQITFGYSISISRDQISSTGLDTPFHPPPATASGLSPRELEYAREYILSLINQARRDAGLEEIALGDNPAAQMHAEDELANCFSSSYGSNGTKPYMRYTLAGGTQYSRFINIGTDYCPPDPYRYRYKSLEEKIKELSYDGDVLLPYLKKVNLGFAYSKPNLWVVREFEGDYIEFQGAPRISNDGQLSFSASAKNGAVFNTDGTGIRIYYDPPPHELTRGQLARTYCYSTGKQMVADLERPLSQYSYYVEGEFDHANDFCVDPYQVSPDSASANSYEDSSRLHDEAKRKSTGETEPYKSKWLTAEVWDISQNQTTLSADLRTVLAEKGAGVYTVVIWGEIDGEDIPLSDYSIFVTNDQIASISLDEPPHPPPATASGLSPRELEYAKEYMLNLINQARRDAGLEEIALGDNPAAQMHAEDELANCFSSQYGSDGTKSYMRYTLAGGTQYSRFITTGTNYCPPDPYRYRYKSLEEKIKELSYDGDVLLPYLKKVNLGFAYSKPNLWVVREFEGDYIEYDKLPVIDEEGKLSFSASVKNGAVVKDDALGVQIYYDPPLRELTRGQLSRTYCYSTGKQLAGLREPLTEGWEYTEDEYTETDGICVDPYEIDPDSEPADSYEDSLRLHDEARQASTGYTEPYTVVWLTTDQWTTTENSFSVSADIRELLVENGPGIYTILIWGEIDGEDIPLSNYSIFISESNIPE